MLNLVDSFVYFLNNKWNFYEKYEIFFFEIFLNIRNDIYFFSYL